MDGVVGEMLGVVAVGMAARDAEDPLAEQVRYRVPHLAGPYTFPASLSSTAPLSELE